MKILRIAGVVIFLLSTLTFAGYKGYQMKNEDNTSPVITCENSSITLSTSAPADELLKGVTAYDEKDGDVGNSLMIESISNMNLKRTRTITYAAFDSDNHITKTTRELVYSDYNPPRYVLTKPLIFNVGEEDILKNITVTDCIDGDLTDKIKYITDDYELGSAQGSYPVEFQVTNSAGETAFLPTIVEFRFLDLQQELGPQILLSNYIVYMKKGAPFDPRAFIKAVEINGKTINLLDQPVSGNNTDSMSKNDIAIASDVNRMEAGVYHVEYSITTKDGITGDTRLIVVVEE